MNLAIPSALYLGHERLSPDNYEAFKSVAIEAMAIVEQSKKPIEGFFIVVTPCREDRYLFYMFDYLPGMCRLSYNCEFSTDEMLDRLNRYKENNIEIIKVK